MKKILLVKLLVLALFSSLALAYAPTWHTSKIQSIYPLSPGNTVVLIFENNSGNCFLEDGVTARTYHYIQVGQNGVDTTALKNMYALALTAFATDNPITINFDRESSGCFINRMLLHK